MTPCEICGTTTYDSRGLCSDCVPFPRRQTNAYRMLKTWEEVLAEDPDVLDAARLAYQVGGRAAVAALRETTGRARNPFVKKRRRP